MVITLVHYIQKQLQYFNKVLTLFIVILVIMSVVIAGLITLKFQEINTVNSLDQIIRETLEKYKPDREAQQLSRDLIKDTNEDVDEIKEIVKNISNFS
jgi:uncharacterized membrane protein